MSSLPRLFAITLLPAAALVAVLARWWMQGTGNLWSKASLQPYVPDPDLGFRQLEKGYLWLGLDSAGEDGSAELEIDLASLDSGIAKRDGHLKSADYVDVAVSPLAKVRVHGVKKQGDDAYSAIADVSLGDKNVSWPVAFKVVKKNAASATIEAEHEFDRSELGVGKKEGDPVAPGLVAKMRLTLAKS